MENSTTPGHVVGGLTPPETLVKICLLWTVLQRSKPPPACHDVLQMRDFTDNQLQLDHLIKNRESLQNWKIRLHSDYFDHPDRMKDHMNNFQFHYQHSSRSLSVIGVLGGIVLILFFVALSTCIKHRRNLYAADRYTHRENYAREILVDHLRQLRSHRNTSTAIALRNDRPPAYDEVVNKPSTSSDDPDGAEGGSSEEPPSYSEATNTEMSEVTIINCNYVDPIESQELSEHNTTETEVTIETRGIIHEPNSQ